MADARRLDRGTPGRAKRPAALVAAAWRPCRASSGSPLLFVAPLYVVLAILFGGVDPILRQPVPVWNPLDWDFSQFNYVLGRTSSGRTPSSARR